jgi:hypothetical protein
VTAPNTPGGTVACVQSNYIPWKGYFDMIARSELFVLLDDVQYTRRDWRNRNLIKTPAGPRWLTIPVETKGRYTQLIKDTRVSDPGWAAVHWEQLRQHYRLAPCFRQERDWLEPLYRDAAPRLGYLSDINRLFLEAVCGRLGITTPLASSADYDLEPGKSARLLAICRQAGATCYLSGPAARDYLETDLFAHHGITVAWMDYADYPEYPQLHPPFSHGVTILDLLLNVGDLARDNFRSNSAAPHHLDC